MSDCPTCGEPFTRGMVDRVVNADNNTVGFFCNVCASKYPPGPNWPLCPACGGDKVVVQGTVAVDNASGEAAAETMYTCEHCTHAFKLEAV